MKNNMKSRMVKLASVGLSVAMAAAPMTAYAEDTVPATDVIPEAQPEATGELIKAEQPTPVTDYVREVADGLVDEKEPEQERPVVGPAIPVSPIEEALPQVTRDAEPAPATNEEKPSEASPIDTNLVNAQNALGDLADETEKVEIAQGEGKDAALDAAISETIAEKEANEANDAADKASNSLSDEDIAAAKTALTEAKDALADAEGKATTANEKLEAAKTELNAMLKANGLEDVEHLDLNLLLDVLRGESEASITETCLLDLDGNTKTAIMNMIQAYRHAQDNATAAVRKQEEAQLMLEQLEDNLLTQIALETDQDKLAKLLYEYYLRNNVTGYVENSVVFGEYDATNGFYHVTYKVLVDEEEKDATADIDVKKAEGSVEIVAKTSHDEDDLTNLISAEVEAKDAVPESWKTKDGKEFVNTSTTHIIQKEDGTFYAIDTVTSTVVEVVPADSVATTKVGDTTYSYEEVANSEQTSYEKTDYTVVDSYYKKTVTDKKSAKNKRDLENIVADAKDKNAKVYGRFLGFPYEIDPYDVNWFDNFVGQVNAFFTGKAFDVYVSYDVDDTSRPKDTHKEDGIYEIKTKNYVETATTYESDSKTSGAFYNIRPSKAERECRAALAQKKAELIAAGYTITKENAHKTDLTGNFWRYELKWEKTTVVTNTVTKVTSKTKYAADDYTDHTEAQAAVEHQDAVYGTKTVYEDGRNLAGTTTDATAIRVAKEFYDETSSIANDTASVEAANRLASEIDTKLGDVMSAIHMVITLKDKAGTYVSHANTIKGIITTAEQKITAAETENQNQKNQQNQEQGTGDEGTSTGTTTVNYSAIPVTSSVAGTPVVTIAGEQVPLAGNRTARRAATNVAANNDEAADAGEAEEVVVEPEEEEDEDLEMIQIEDEETAKAGGTQTRSWLWALILALLAAAGFTTYKVSKAKKDN